MAHELAVNSEFPACCGIRQLRKENKIDEPTFERVPDNRDANPNLAMALKSFKTAAHFWLSLIAELDVQLAHEINSLLHITCTHLRFSSETVQRP